MAIKGGQSVFPYRFCEENGICCSSAQKKAALTNPLGIPKPSAYSVAANSKVSAQLQLLHSALREPFLRG